MPGAVDLDMTKVPLNRKMRRYWSFLVPLASKTRASRLLQHRLTLGISNAAQVANPKHLEEQDGISIHFLLLRHRIPSKPPTTISISASHNGGGPSSPRWRLRLIYCMAALPPPYPIDHHVHIFRRSQTIGFCASPSPFPVLRIQ